jgi:predicted PurR-regulated permease PerM
VQRPDALTRIGRFLTVCVVGAVALWLLYKVRAVLLAVIVGMAIAYPWPRSSRHSRAIGRTCVLSGSTLAYLTVFVGLAAVSVLRFRPVADDARIFSTTLPDSVQRLDAWLARTSAGLR